MENSLFFLILLIAGHTVADFWMQSDTLAKLKNRHRASENKVPLGQIPQTVWPYFLTSHAIHHGLCVGLITGSLGLGIAETISHWLIDFGKCENWYGIHFDQYLHFMCKIIWVMVLI